MCKTIAAHNAVPPPIISFEGFTFCYRAQTEPTIKDINLKIYPGQKVLIAGPSGSGKSTLAHCINGLIPFNYPGEARGSCMVGGAETKDQNIFKLSKLVGTVLQDTDGQFVGLSAGEDIAFALENDYTPPESMRARVADAANVVGIGGMLDATPHKLSGGQKQRVSMAGILVNKVEVLVFDEPLANLDPATGKTAIELIDKLHKETNATIIIIEHRLEDVLHRPVDRIVVMEHGCITADDTPEVVICSGVLERAGIRQPLYVSAMKYAGVEVSPQKRPDHIDSLLLPPDDIALVHRWCDGGCVPEEDASPIQEILRLEDVCFDYPKEAGGARIERLGFSVGQGEMAAIVGHNGAGKSTVAKLICGFETPQKGRILLRGQDITTTSMARRGASIGYVMQNPNQMLIKPFVAEEVALGLRLRGVAETQVQDRVNETLKTCGLYPFRNWPVSALSYGQKKRVTIASVLVLAPDIIILDEPTAGQDYRHYTEIMEFLRDLNKGGITVLLITHDMHLMLEYAPRVIVIHEGRLLADTSSAQLLCDPKLTARASLKETSLFYMAQACGMGDTTAVARRFVRHERDVARIGRVFPKNP